MFREVLIVNRGAIELEGVSTNAALLERALQHEAFLAGAVDTGFFSRVVS